MKKTRVYILQGGDLAIDGYRLWWNQGPSGDVRIPVYSVLIDHEEGLFLFDTGFDLAHGIKYWPIDSPVQSPEETIPSQLAKLGLKPQDVTHVMHSHLHYDHVGGNKYLTHALFILHEKEFAEAKDPQPFEAGYSDLGWAPQLDRLAPGVAADAKPDQLPRFELLKGDVEVASGLWLYETPGHSAGHYSLLVQLEGRKPMIFAGDAAYSPKNLDNLIAPGIHLDAVNAVKSLARLRDLRTEHDAEIFFSHDYPSYRTYLKSPQYYE
jgi:4-pyridoxolactonase